MPEDVDEIFIHRLKELLREERLRKGINFRTLGSLCGVSHGYLALAERSNVQPTLLVFKRWAKGLEVDLPKLIRKAEKM